MLRKTITYEDFDGNQHTEDFYFNLTKAEIIDMILSSPGQDLQSYLSKIIESKDGGQIMDAFRDIIRRSYGVRSEDGKRFVKSKEATDDFIFHAAYDVFFTELVTDANAGAAFVNAIIPKSLAEAAQSEINRKNLSAPEAQADTRNVFSHSEETSQYSPVPEQPAPAQPTFVAPPQDTNPVFEAQSQSYGVTPEVLNDLERGAAEVRELRDREETDLSKLSREQLEERARRYMGNQQG